MENATVDIGVRLRELREEKGLSVEEIAQNIKIPARTLLQIEAGEVDNLPHPVYARSFIKTYGRALGMNPEELAAGVDALFDIKQEIEPSSVYTPVDEPSFSWKGPLLAIILVCIVAGAGWFLYATVFKNGELGSLTENLMSRGEAFISGAKNDGADAPTVEFSQAPSTSQQSNSDSSDKNAGRTENVDDTEQDEALKQAPVQPDMGPVPGIPSSHNSETAPETRSSAASTEPFGANKPITNAAPGAPSIAEQPGANSAESADAENTESAAPENTSSALAAGAAHEVVVTANTADCWIRVTGPGMERKDVMVRKGQSVTLPYAQEMTMRLGNIFGVTITHDGQEVPFSRDGAPVRTLNFPL